jgi:preprotein translocase subunit YajC
MSKLGPSLRLLSGTTATVITTNSSTITLTIEINTSSVEIQVRMATVDQRSTLTKLKHTVVANEGRNKANHRWSQEKESL